MSLFRSKKKIANEINRALYEYWIREGAVNFITDDPEQYIEEGYTGNTTVFSIIDRINKMRKQARLMLMEKGKDGEPVEVKDHDLLKFTTKVNDHTSTDEFISQHLIYLLTIGEFFVYKPQISEGPNKGKVIEIHPFPSAEVQIIEGNVWQPVKGYKIKGSMNIELPATDVYHSKFFNPDWNRQKSLHGLSPLKAAARTVSRLNQSEITQLKQLDNQGPPYVLFKKSNNTISKRLSDPQRDDLIQKIKTSSKTQNRNLPLILRDEYGKLDLGRVLADMDLVNSSKSGIEALCSVYGIPPELFGYGQKTYNNMGTARKAAWTDCIMPNLSHVAETLNACTIADIPEYEGLYWSWDFSQVEELQEGLAEMVAWMVQAHWTGNEIRVATGKNRVDDPLMDEPIFSLSDQFLSEIGSSVMSGSKDFSDYLK